MKPIKTSTDIKTWCVQRECNECKSLLEIYCKDINYDLRYRGQESDWSAVCCLCGHGIFFKEEDLPKLVRVDIIAHRYLVNSSSD